METNPNNRRRPSVPVRRVPSGGFTLLELVVAMGVLMVLTLIVGSLFRQATSSWNSGRVRGEGSMIARGILGSVFRDLATAIDGTPYGIHFEASGGRLSFACLKEPDEDGRDVHQITYAVNGGSATRTDKVWNGNTCVPVSPASVLFKKEESQNFEILNDDVFTAIGASPGEKDSDAAPWPSDAPTAVKIRIVFSQKGVFSGVSVRSLGKDGKADEDDDDDIDDDIVSN